MPKPILAAAAVVAAIFAVPLAGASQASAFFQGNGCNHCAPAPQVRQVVVPPQYRTVEQQVLVAPARKVRHLIPAVYGTVQQQVLVAPARVGWVAECGVCNAQWRQVLIPAQYQTVERQVIVTPARVEIEVIPAQYQTVTRTVLVTPQRTYWAPAGCNTCGH